MSTDRKTYAESLGIKIDGRWSDERIEQEIAKAEAAQAAPQTVALRVVRDFWKAELDETGLPTRVSAGTIVHVAPMAALDMVESGAAERVRG